MQPGFAQRPAISGIILNLAPTPPLACRLGTLSFCRRQVFDAARLLLLCTLKYAGGRTGEETAEVQSALVGLPVETRPGSILFVGRLIFYWLLSSGR